jgi:uncharacterized protein YjbI with pentapeptide repeats
MITLVIIGLVIWVILAIVSLPEQPSINFFSFAKINKYLDESWEKLFYTGLLGVIFLISTLYLTENIDLLVSVGGVSALLIGIIGMRAPKESWVRDIAPELIGIAIGVVAIDQLYQIRIEYQEKQAIIRQLSSPSNEFALDALRLANERGLLRAGDMDSVGTLKANLQNANLSEASLQRVYLWGANLQNANLSSADLLGSNLVNVNFQNANLSGASLNEADLSSANLQGANLSYANLQDANLWGVTLEGADLTGANLQNTVLWLTNLVDAEFLGADLRTANLGRAHLQGANLVDATLYGATYTTETVWPDDFDPKAAGAILVEWNTEKGNWVPANNDN